MTGAVDRPEGVEISGAMGAGYERVLTTDALAFIADMERAFGQRRRDLLLAREDLQAKIDGGWLPDFRADTAHIRDGDWTITGTPDDLADRRVEITGPVDRKMIINALNSGASVFMADFEDASAPTWANMVEGQLNLADAGRREIDFTDPVSGKQYALNEQIAVLLVRPRGWHLEEAHMTVDGRAMSGGLFDFGLYFFHNANELLAHGTAPYFYLPKLEHAEEARLWNDVFVWAQQRLSIANGTVKVTVLIETILAAFEMDEILYELKDHIVGLNCGRWDYIFSFIKTFRNNPDFVIADRNDVGMTRHFLRSYSQLLIKTCHRRKAHAMGGMAAQIPIKGDEEANRAAMAKVRADKEREAGDGHDGTWVAHPGLIPIAKGVFDETMPQANQLARMRQDVHVGAKDLLDVPKGEITEAGLRANLNVGVQYVEAWLRGVGCVPIYNLMEDAATAEISRTQIWQWIAHGAEMTDGRTVSHELALEMLDDELAKIREMIGPEAFDDGAFAAAAGIFRDMLEPSGFANFLTQPAYEQLVASGA